MLAVPGVVDVLWLDDLTGRDALLSMPLSFLDPDYVTRYYRDGHALFELSITSGREGEALPALYALVGERGAISGEAANAYETQNIAGSETSSAFLILVPVILLILIFATGSWIEPFLVLASIGVAVLLNMGTNALFPQVSYITTTVSPILQLAVSLDYAIFLLHSFATHRNAHDAPHAMVLAMKDAVRTISASAATTMIGFAALIFMRFGIGSDLGLNLLKGIVLSFLSIMILLPALSLCCAKWLNRTAHRSFLPNFSGLSRVLGKCKTPALVLVCLIAVPCFLAQGHSEFFYGMESVTESSRVGQDQAEIEALFGKENLLVLLLEDTPVATEAALGDALAQLPHITAVVSYANSVGALIPPDFVPTDAAAQFYSGNLSRVLLYTDTPEEGDAAFATVEAVQQTVVDFGVSGHLLGQSATLYDMKEIISDDNVLVSALAIIGIFLVLLVTLRSPITPLLLIFTIQSAIWINLSVAYFTDNPLSFIGYLIINTVQLGATVDYAILLTNQYLGCRRHTLRGPALLDTMRQSMATILSSACILATAGFVLAATSSNPIVSELGVLLGRGTILSCLLVLVVLPALLHLFDRLIVPKGAR